MSSSALFSPCLFEGVYKVCERTFDVVCIRSWSMRNIRLCWNHVGESDVINDCMRLPSPPPSILFSLLLDMCVCIERIEAV